MHKLRTALAVGGIAVGVGSLIAIQLVYNALIETYEGTVRTISDGADLQISNGEAGVPEELLEPVGATAGVARAVVAVRGFVSLRNRQRGKLYLHGIDVLAGWGTAEHGARAPQVTVEDPIVFISEPDSVAVTESAARRYGWRLGRHLEVRSPAGVRRLTVRAVFEATDWSARFLGDRLLVMDLPAAQRLMGMEGRVSQIDVHVSPGVDVARVEERLAQVVGGRAHVGRSAASGKTLERLLGSYRYGLGVGAGLCVIVALYVVVNTMIISVVQQEHDLGVLQLVGMTRRQVLMLIASEALALGGLGCVAGVGVALWLAQVLAARGARSVGVVYLTIADPVIRLDPGAVAWGLAVALLVAGAAVVAAGREALRRRAWDLVRRDSRDAGGSRAYHHAGLAGAAMLAVTSAMWVAGRRLSDATPLLGVAMLLGLLVGMALMVPAGVRLLARRADRPLESFLGPIGLLASRVIAGEVGCVALSASAFLASLAGTLAFAGLLASLEGSLVAGLQTVFSNVDLIVTSGAGPLQEYATAMPETVIAEIAAVRDVSYVDAIRVSTIPYKGSLIALVASDARLLEDGRRAVALAADDTTQALAVLARGEGVLVTQSFARRFEHRIGDVISLATPTGLVGLPIVGIYLFEASAGDVGVIRLDRRLYQRYWKDAAVSAIHATLVDGADTARAIRRISHHVGRRHDLFMLTTKELHQQYHAVLATLGNLLTPMLVASCVIGSLGLMAGRLMSVQSRRQLLAILRAVGATRGQRAAMLTVESTIIGLMSAVLAAVVGSVLGYVQVTVILRDACRIAIPYVHPTGVMISMLVAATAVASIGGYWQERALVPLSRGDMVHDA
jgi:putative ABC transport system permease protein